MKQTQNDPVTPRKDQLFARLALLMQRSDSDAAEDSAAVAPTTVIPARVEDRTVLAYLEGKLSEFERAEIRAAMANDPLLMEHFMALADQFQNQPEPQNADPQRTHPQPAPRKVNQSRWWFGSGAMGGLLAASLAVFMVLTPSQEESLDQQLQRGFAYLPTNSTTWQLDRAGRKSLTSTSAGPDIQSLMQGIANAQAKAGVTPTAASSNSDHAELSTDCHQDQACLQRHQAAELMGTWAALTHLYCSAWNSVPNHAWQAHLAMATPLTTQLEKHLTDTALLHQSTALLTLAKQHLQEEPPIQLRPICRATEQFLADFSST